MPKRRSFDLPRALRLLACLAPLGVALVACDGDTFLPGSPGQSGSGGGGGKLSAGGAGQAGSGQGGSGSGVSGSSGAAAGQGGSGGSAAGSGGAAGMSGSMAGSGAAGMGAAGAAGTGAASGSAGKGGAAGKGEGGAGGQPQEPRIHDTACSGKTPNGPNACGQQCQCQAKKWSCNATRGDSCTEIVGAVCDSVSGRCLCRGGFTYCPPASGEGDCGAPCQAELDLYYACRKTSGEMTTCACAGVWTCM